MTGTTSNVPRPNHATHTGTDHATDTADLLRAALTYAKQGWRIFPLIPGGKRPALHGEASCRSTGPCGNGHQGWEQRATTDPDRIRTAWTHAPYNIGIACGPSGLVVIDLDTPKPGKELPAELRAAGMRDGHDVFAALCAQAGQTGQAEPSDTYTVATPSGGRHLYFQHPGAGPLLRNTQGGTTGSLGPLIDTRAHGGYVVAPGSLTSPGKPYTALNDLDPDPLLSWLADRLTPVPLPPQRPVKIDLPHDRRGAYLRAAINGQLDLIVQTHEGNRNNQLYLSAVALGQLVAGGALDAEQTRLVLTKAGLDAGLRTREVHKTIKSGFKDGAFRPRRLTGELAA
jgi:hypothetical protein